MDKQTISTIKTIIIAALIITLIVRFSSKDYIVIETNGVEPYSNVYPNTYEVRDRITKSPGCFIRKERYTVPGLESNERCASVFNTGDPQWDVTYAPGTNGVCSDNVWHSMEPRAVLVNNCMSCKSLSSDYNAPSGL